MLHLWRIWSVPMLLIVAGLGALEACAPTPTSTTAGPSEYDVRLTLSSSGKYEELASRIEGQIKDLSSASTWDLQYLCRTYGQLKRYTKLFACLDQLERKLAGGSDGSYKSASSYLMTRPYYSSSAAVREATDREIEVMMAAEMTLPSVAASLRAQALLELGDYKGAVQHAKRAEELQVIVDPMIGRAGSFSPLLALAHALNDDRTEALDIVGRIEGRDVMEGAERHLRSGVLDAKEFRNGAEAARFEMVFPIYQALGEYRRCLTFKPVVQRRLMQLAKIRSDMLRLAETRGESKVPRSSNPSRVTSAEVAEGALGYGYGLRYGLSKCEYETGQVSEAKAGYDELLTHPTFANQGSIYRLALFERGQIAEREGQRKEAIDYYRRAIEVIERQRSSINTEASRIGFVGDKQQVYHRLVAALIAEGQAAQAFEYVERAKARALVDLLASKQDFATPSAAPQQVAMLVKDWDQVEEDSRVPVRSSEESSRRSARGVQVRANLQAASPELASLVMVTETASSAIQALLAPDETLLEYYYQGDDLYAFVVTRGTVKGVKLNGANLAQEVEAFRKALQDPKSGDVGALSRNLHGRLIQSVATQVTTKHVLIVGHGALHYLPFTALSDGAGYLVDQYSLRLLPSASVLQFLKGRQAQQGGSLLAFGNPDLGDAQYDLKFAQDEVQAIAKTFPQAKVLVRQEATKGAFKSLGPQFSYLHLATHGKFDPDAPLKSGLLLAKDAQEDGFLSLGDLYSLRLNADLVILSACETGLGKISNGDDVVGLTRGFLYAGSSSIVASLWEVDDRATSLLMTEFYANLKKGDKREALRQAQLTTKKQYPHPFYWAAFQLTGMP